MAFVYHLCAPDFRGEVLYPLDSLRSAYPDIYLRERVKYEGRDSVLEYKVPFLDVTWGATVNLSALDPCLLVKERRRLGVPFSNLLLRRVLRIPVQRIVQLPAVRYNSATHWSRLRQKICNIKSSSMRSKWRFMTVSGFSLEQHSSLVFGWC